MNQKIFIKIDQLLQSFLPTKLIKRGNAFAVIEICDSDTIKKSLKTIDFDGLNILTYEKNEVALTLTGECYITENSFSEEYELHVEIQNYSSPEDISVNEYLLDIANKEIYLRLQG